MANDTKFTMSETKLLHTALETLMATQKRARNNSKNPEFVVIYDKIIKEIHDLAAKI